MSKEINDKRGKEVPISKRIENILKKRKMEIEKL